MPTSPTITDEELAKAMRKSDENVHRGQEYLEMARTARRLLCLSSTESSYTEDDVRNLLSDTTSLIDAIDSELPRDCISKEARKVIARLKEFAHIIDAPLRMERGKAVYEAFYPAETIRLYPFDGREAKYQEQWCSAADAAIAKKAKQNQEAGNGS